MAKEKASAVDDAGTGKKDLNPSLPEDGGLAAAAAELPFSEMIARWLDDGDKLHERDHEPSEFSAEVDGHEGRVGAFVASARAQAHRHRRVLGGAALLIVIVSVIAFRRTNHSGAGDMVSVESTPGSVATTQVVAEPPPPSPPPAVIPPAPEVALVAPPVQEIKAPPEPAPAAPVAEAPPLPEIKAPPVPAPVAAVAKAPPRPEIKASPEPAPAAPVAKAPPVIAAPASPAPAPKVAAREDAPAKSVPSSKSPPTSAAHQLTATAPVPAPAITAAVAAAPRKSQPPAGTPASGPALSLEACKAALIRQRSRDALSACSQVFGGDPHSAENMVLLARADLLAGRTSETMTLARRAVAANPRQADAYLLIGTIAQTTGQRQEARSAYETYLQLSPYGAHASDVKAILRTL